MTEITEAFSTIIESNENISKSGQDYIDANINIFNNNQILLETCKKLIKQDNKIIKKLYNSNPKLQIYENIPKIIQS